MKKGVKKLIAGGTLLLIAAVLPVASFLPMFFHEKGSVLQTPGSLELSIKTPGKYVLWNHYSTVFEGRSYSFGKALPSGLVFSLNEKISGAKVPFQTGSGTLFTSGSEERASVGSFEVTKAGPYVLSITGNPEPRIFSLQKSLFGKAGNFLLSLLLGFVLFFAAGIGSLVLFIMGLVDLVRGSKPAAGEPPAA